MQQCTRGVSGLRVGMRQSKGPDLLDAKENPRAAVTGQQGQGGAARTVGVWWAQAGACICPQFWGSQGHGPQGELALVGGLGSRG